MATQIDSVGIVGLRKAHFKQLLKLVEDKFDKLSDKHSDWYVERHRDIHAWLVKIVDHVYESDIRIKERR